LNSLISCLNIDKDFILQFVKNVKKIKENNHTNLQGKILAQLFFEVSTRTRLSFQTAMIREGGSVLQIPSTDSLRLTYGETLVDTIKCISGYSDVLVLRSPKDIDLNNLTQRVSIPIINAGVGQDEHPSQALTDIYTIYEIFGRFEDLTISIIGPLTTSRVAHSLFLLLQLFPIKINLVGPEKYHMPKKYYREDSKAYIENFDSISDIIENSNIVYLIPQAKEQIETFNKEDWVSEKYSMTEELVKKMPEKSCVLNPLTRFNELPEVIDSYPQAKYFQQAHNGVFVRRAIFNEILNDKHNERI
jgi:aspartate carbamoyltransferase catalytic subunit